MIQPGLVSITFRQLTPAAIIDLMRQAAVTGIEWGGDIHAPHGDLKRAEEVGRMTRDAGLAVAAYGSYYKVGHSEQDGLTFESVLATAQALGAPLIRVWAGQRASADADAAYRPRIVEESRRLATMASAKGLAIAYEFHGGTLTDTNESALRLLEDVHHPAMLSLWQVPSNDVDYCLEGIRGILPYLTNVHVQGAKGENADRWNRYFDLIRSSGRDHYALLEFVRGNAPEAFLEDAQILKQWLMPIGSEGRI